MKQYKIKYTDLSGKQHTDTVQAYSKKDAQTKISSVYQVIRVWEVKK